MSETSNWHIANMTIMRQMCSQATQAIPDTRTWNTGNVKDMSGMFFEVFGVAPDIADWGFSQV